MDIPDLRFDAYQYRTEILRASYDKSWESRGRAVSRLVRDELRSAEHLFKARNCELVWVAPCVGTDDTISVVLDSCDGSSLDRLKVQLHDRSGSEDFNEETAARLASGFLSASLEEWKALAIDR